MEDAFTIIGGILSVMYPELFEAGCRALKEMADGADKIHKGQELPEVLRLWGVPFSVISVICNRDTPPHRDTGSAHCWYDLLVPLGQYEKGKVQFPGLGVQMRYDPGTVVGHLGRVLRHGASCAGDRACLAFYMRENVIHDLGVEGPKHWANISDYSTRTG